ncbi:unnamed protein product [Polarella glacialis]|uniref:Glucosidase II subunit alpha n=1 Tax=Polarella glacialis TaxID=89957 RepID=A0A813II59_POLGL|nr:unnamed protein product [Polarella glacialis]
MVAGPVFRVGGALLQGSLAVLLLAAIQRPADAVDRSKFRTCAQGSFCKRFKSYAQQIQSSGEYVHFVDPASITHKGNEVQALLGHKGIDGSQEPVQPLLLELRFFKEDSAEGNCGVLRVTVSEQPKAGMPTRFRVREGDVAMIPGAGLLPDVVTVLPADATGSVISSSSAGNCSATLRYEPFELDISAGGRVLQSLNARHLLNFEQYRNRDAEPRTALVDATDVDAENLWEESFGEHRDSKPRGPSAVGIDASFRSAPVLVGLAEHATRLHLADPQFDEPYRLFNLDVFEYEVDVPMALYGNIPMVTAVHQWPDGGATSSGFLVVNPSEGFVKVDGPGESEKDSQTWWLFESGVLDLFSFAGPTPQAVLRQYHAVTGWPRMPPLAVLGKHQSRWNYITPEDVAEVDRGFDEHEIPYDFIWLDLEHTHEKRYFTWDPKHFPQEAVDGMLDNLNRSHRKLVTIIDPHLFAGDPNYTVAVRFREKQLMVKKPTGSADFEGFCWPGASNYPDFCDPAARLEWAKLFDFANYPGRPAELYTWNDMNEPSVFDGPEISMPRDNLHKCHTGSFGVEHREVHNLYGFYVHEASVQGHLLRAPGARPFVLTRSFFVGSHRHGAAWTGDNMAEWTHLERSVPMLVSLALCGMSLVGADVAGFMGDPDPELFLRWHQLGIWYPFYRAHVHLTTKRREPWLFGESITAKVRQAVTTRYQLLPMWYTLVAEWALLGLPMVRPIWYHDLGDSEAYRHADSHFLVGEALLVRSPAQGVKTLEVYLPGGDGALWFDFYRPQLVAPRRGSGKVVSQSLKATHLPVFARAGHVLVERRRPRRSAEAMFGDPYTLVVYSDPRSTGSVKATGNVYVDDGRSLDSERGAFIYDRLNFDGAALHAAPAELGGTAVDASWAVGPPAVRALREAPSVPREGLRVERLVFIGLSRAPKGARQHSSGLQEETSAVELQVKVERIAGKEEMWIATVKDPAVYLGSSWKVDLTY